MSEAAPERRAPPAAPAAPKGNVFTRKYGPLPGWGWMLLAAAGVGGYLWWRNHQSASASASTTAGTTTDTSGTTDTTDYADQIATLQAEIAQLQGAASTTTTGAGTTTTGTGSGSGTGTGPASPPKKTGPGSIEYVRHVSDGTQNLNQIAKAANTSVPGIVATSQGSPEDAANLAKLEQWATVPGQKKKGVVYYLQQVKP